jgi:hypothetical protein
MFYELFDAPCLAANVARQHVPNGLAEGADMILGGISGTFKVACGASAKMRAGMGPARTDTRLWARETELLR